MIKGAPTEGDVDATESLEDHFALPWISGLFNTLVPANEETIFRQQLADRAVVTYAHVPEYGMENWNDFQAELFFDGTIRLGETAEERIQRTTTGCGQP